MFRLRRARMASLLPRLLGLSLSSAGATHFLTEDYAVTIYPDNFSRNFLRARQAFSATFNTEHFAYENVLIEARQVGMRLTRSNVGGTSMADLQLFVWRLDAIASLRVQSRCRVPPQVLSAAERVYSPAVWSRGMALLQEPACLCHGDLVLSNTYLTDRGIMPIDFETGGTGIGPVWFDRFTFLSSLPICVRRKVLEEQGNVVGFDPDDGFSVDAVYAVAATILFASQVAVVRTKVSESYFRYVLTRRFAQLLSWDR